MAPADCNFRMKSSPLAVYSKSPIPFTPETFTIDCCLIHLGLPPSSRAMTPTKTCMYCIVNCSPPNYYRFIYTCIVLSPYTRGHYYAVIIFGSHFKVQSRTCQNPLDGVNQGALQVKLDNPARNTSTMSKSDRSLIRQNPDQVCKIISKQLIFTLTEVLFLICQNMSNA